jgi:uncharacterized protein YjfI (DUF2170 family)
MQASFLKANKSITMNGQENHLRVQMQDFRDLSVDTLKEAKFDLITGTPPCRLGFVLPFIIFNFWLCRIDFKTFLFC